MKSSKSSPNWAWKPPPGVKANISRGNKKEREHMQKLKEWQPNASRRQS